MTRRSTIALAASALTIYSGAALADLQYEVEAGVGHSDNITRVADGEIDQTIALLGLDLTWDTKGPRLTADVHVDADYLHYLDDIYDSEVVGTGDAELNFAIVPERLNWNFQDSYGQEITDPFAPVTPETREGVNYFTTGPDFVTRLGQSGVLRLYGSWSSSEYERSPLDSTRVVGGLAIGKKSAGGHDLAFNAVTERIEFDDEINSDFDRDSLYLSYALEASRTDISVEAGYTWLEMENGDKSDDPRFTVSVDRELTNASTLSLTLGTQLTDSSDVLRSAVDSPPVGGSSQVTATSDPYVNDFVTLGWSFVRRRTTINLSVDWEQDTYETQTVLDRTMTMWNASIDRQITPQLSAGLSASLIEEDFDNTTLTTDTTQFGATLNWQLTRAVGLRLVADRYERDSSDGEELQENRVFLSVYFRPVRARASDTTP
jgi:hypothetical protein